MTLEMPNDSLSDPGKGPSGKRKVMAVRDVLVQERKRLLGLVEDQSKAAVNLHTQVVREARFANTTAARPEFWGGIQIAGKTIDALTGQIYAYDNAIQLLNRILGESTERSNNSGRKDEGKAEEGQGEAAPQEQEAAAEPLTGDAAKRAGERKPVVRKRSPQRRARGEGGSGAAGRKPAKRTAKGR